MKNNIKNFAHFAGFHLDEETGELYTKEGGERITKGLEAFATFIVSQCISSCRTVGSMCEITNDGEMARKTKETALTCENLISDFFGVKDEQASID